MLGAQQVLQGRVGHGTDVDLPQPGVEDIGRGVERPVGEAGLLVATFEVCRARHIDVERGHLEEETHSGGELGDLVVDGEVIDAQPTAAVVPDCRGRSGGHRSRPSSSVSPGRVAARLVRAQAMAASSGTPVHSSMKVFLNSSASTQPTRG